MEVCCLLFYDTPETDLTFYEFSFEQLDDALKTFPNFKSCFTNIALILAQFQKKPSELSN